MDHIKVHKKMISKHTIHELRFEKFMAFMIFKILQNYIIHHIDVQVRILKPSKLLYVFFKSLYKSSFEGKKKDITQNSKPTF